MTDAVNDPEALPPRLALRLAGRPSVIGADAVPHDLASRDAALLAWLALEGATPRARMAQLLWPESDHEAALGLLRQRLFQLKKRLGEGIVDGRSTLVLGPSVGHDLDDAAGVLGDLAVDWGGPFATWLDARRAERRAVRRERLIARIEQAEEARDWPSARRDLDALVALEPLSEDAHRRVVRHHYLAGDRAAALLAFDRLERMLKDEVGARPAPETLALLATIEAASGAVPAPVSGVLPASVLRPPRLVGRKAELAAAAAAWSAGHVLAFIGEAGLGKSRLLNDFVAGRPGIVAVAARPGDAEVPLATLARLLREIVARPDGVLPPAAPERQALARVLPELDVAGPVVEGGPEGRRLGLLLGLCRFLAGRAGLAGLVVDDLHFADAASLELLAGLVDETRQGDDGSGGLRWAFAWRPVDAPSPVLALQHGLEDTARLASVPIGPLDRAALAELVDTLGLPGVSGEKLAPALLRRTGGNPLFVLETLKQAWAERSFDALADGEVSARPLSAARLIERRLARLSSGALALARVAAMAGVDFQVALAERVLGASALQFADALAELERAQVLQGDAFAHDLVFEAVAAGVPATIARHAHAQIADWLAGRGGEPARIARHWIDGGQPERALEWLTRAAEAASRAHRVRERVAFLETKSGIERDLGRAAEAFATLLAAMRVASQYDLQADLGEAMFERLDALAASEVQRVAVASLRAEVHLERGEPAAAIEMATPALRASHLLGHTSTTMALRGTLGTAEMMLGNSARALQHLEVCVVWFDEHGSGDESATLHSNLGLLYDNLGRLEEAHAHFKLTESLAQAASDYPNMGVVAINLARNRLLSGDLDATERYLQRAEQLSVAHDAVTSHLASLRLLRTSALGLRSRHGEALRHAELALEAAERQQPGLIDHARIRLGQCWASLGQWTRLRQAIAEVDAERAGSPVVRIGRARLHGWYAEATGDVPARERAREVLAAEHALLGADARPDLRLPLEIELAQWLPPADAILRLEAVRRDAERFGHRPIVLAARLRTSVAALAVGDAPRAIEEARGALALQAQGLSNSALKPAELWWRAAEALAAGGQPLEAAQVAEDGATWLRRIAAEQVPDAFRRSFLEREPANQALLALAARLGRPDAPRSRKPTSRTTRSRPD